MDEKRLKDEQRKMRKFVKQFMASPEEKMEEASLEKIGKTGNVLLDKINLQVEKQRNTMRFMSGGNAGHGYQELID